MNSSTTARMRCALLCLIIFSLGLPTVRSQEASPSGSAETFPDTPEGLKSLLNEMLAAAEVNDQPRLQQMIADADIPDYQNWFHITFSAASARNWADEYEKNRSWQHDALETKLTNLSSKNGQFVIARIDPVKEFGASGSAPDCYFARWVPGADPAATVPVTPLGYFYFVDGKFRLDNTAVIALRIRPTTQPPADMSAQPVSPDEASTTFVAGLKGITTPLCKYCPAAQFPKSERKSHTEGNVMVRAVVTSEGRILNPTVIRSLSPDFDAAALKAVQTWQLTPAVDQSGKAVPVQQMIEIAFHRY